MNARTILAVAAFSATLVAALTSSNGEDRPPRVDITTREYFHSALRAQTELDRFIPDQSVLLFGDSIMNAVNSRAVLPNAVNLSISGNMTGGMIYQMRRLDSLRRADAIVLQGGINDMLNNPLYDATIVDDYQAMLDIAPETGRIYLLGVLPARDATLTARISAIDAHLRRLCAASSQCHYVNASLLADDLNVLRAELTSDGIHLNAEGIALLQNILAAALTH